MLCLSRLPTDWGEMGRGDTLSEKPGQEHSRLHQQLGPPMQECGQKQDRCVSTKGRGALMPGKGLACFWEQWGAAESF